MISAALPVLLMAAISIYVGFYHIFFFIKRPSEKINLYFSLLCFSVAYYQISCGGLYMSQSFTEGIFWQQFNFSGVALIAIFFTSFVYEYFNRKSKIFLPRIIIFSIFIIIASFIKSDFKKCSILRILFSNYFTKHPLT